MNIPKTIKMLIVGLVVMGFTSTSMAFVPDSPSGFEEVVEYEGNDTYDWEYTVPEEEETVAEAEAEPETEPMEEEEYTGEEERVAPVAGEGEEEITIPEIY